MACEDMDCFCHLECSPSSGTRTDWDIRLLEEKVPLLPDSGVSDTDVSTMLEMLFISFHSHSQLRDKKKELWYRPEFRFCQS